MASGALDSPKSSAARADEHAPYGRGGGAMIRCGEVRQKGGPFCTGKWPRTVIGLSRHTSALGTELALPSAIARRRGPAHGASRPPHRVGRTQHTPSTAAQTPPQFNPQRHAGVTTWSASRSASRSARAGARAGVRAVARSVAAARLVVADKVVEVPTMEAAQVPQPEADQEVIGSTRGTSRRRSGRR